MVDRARLLVAALVVAGGLGLFATGSGPADLGGTVRPNQVPTVDVAATPAAGARGTVTVRYADAGGRADATLTVDWNGTVAVASGDRQLTAPGDAVVLEERVEGDPTVVALSVTATGDGRSAVVYRATLRV